MHNSFKMSLDLREVRKSHSIESFIDNQESFIMGGKQQSENK